MPSPLPRTGLPVSRFAFGGERLSERRQPPGEGERSADEQDKILRICKHSGKTIAEKSNPQVKEKTMLRNRIKKWTAPKVAG